jgi:hypothetical protein
MAYKKGKYNFTLDGVKYTDISGYTYEGDENKLNINVAGTASMVRQYIAAKYPKFYGRGFSWVKSESYSGGDSIRVYLNRIPLEYYEKISKELKIKFQEGSFNGMDDSYTYSKSAEKSNEGYVVDYGTKYLFVNNVPPYDAPEEKLPAPDWDKILSSSTPKPSTTSFKPKTSSSGSGFANKGQLLMTRAGWEFYKKKIDDGRIVYNLYILRDTPKNRGDWNEIKGEMLVDTGFKWGGYGNFQRWGEIKNENEVLEKAGAILSKYYTGKNQDLPKPSEEPQKQSKESIEKAIKALQILANFGDESAKKQIISLKYLL